MGLVIALLNHKGGVGKTTSAVNIGAGLAELGKKVLLLDLDPQANLTLSLGVPRLPITIYEAMRGDGEPSIHIAKPNLSVIGSTLELAGIEMELLNEAGREFILKEMLNPLVPQYDYIIIDCPPSLGLLTVNALTVSDTVYIPLQTEFLALQGLARIKQVIQKVKLRLNRGLDIGGVIATMYDHRKVLNRDVVETIRKFFDRLLFETFIRDNVALAEAPAQRVDIFVYDRSSAGAEDYLNLCKEIITRTGQQ